MTYTPWFKTQAHDPIRYVDRIAVGRERKSTPSFHRADMACPCIAKISSLSGRLVSRSGCLWGIIKPIPPAPGFCGWSGLFWFGMISLGASTVPSNNHTLTAARPARSVRIQSVLYRLPKSSVVRALDYVAAAATVARRAGLLSDLVVAYGDCSPEPVLTADELEQLRREHGAELTLEYSFFDANLGSAAGHNRLLAAATSDAVMILNPDVLVSPRLLVELRAALDRPGVGFAEARQIPIEHPKDYDAVTGETSWGSTACLLGDRSLFEALNGFDATNFFLYGDDVDLSWRARLLGWTVVFCPQATVFHDKRLNRDGSWPTSPAERYYSAEAGLMLPYKFSRPDLTEAYLTYFRASADPELERAAEAFAERERNGTLPVPLDENHTVAQFVDGAYAPNRFKPR